MHKTCANALMTTTGMTTIVETVFPSPTRAHTTCPSLKRDDLLVSLTQIVSGVMFSRLGELRRNLLRKSRAPACFLFGLQAVFSALICVSERPP